MPNHTHNTISFEDGSNPKELLSPYIDKDNGEIYLNFDKIIPEPKTFEECDPRFRSRDGVPTLISEAHRPWFDWYGWRNNHWGTKWNSYCCEFVADLFSFLTAWEPPFPVIQELANKLNKTIVLTYEQEEWEDGESKTEHFYPKNNH